MTQRAKAKAGWAMRPPLSNPRTKREALEELVKLEAKYFELLFAVGMKFPNETRHQTALRYIRNAEISNRLPCQAKEKP